MKSGQVILCSAMAMLAACNRPQTNDAAPQANVTVPPAPAAPSAPPATGPAPAPQPAPPPLPPVATPAPPTDATDAVTDPKSVGAALDVAHQFADLVSRGKFDQAYAMLGGRGGFASVADLKRNFAPYSGLSVLVHDTPAPEPEGAAGSIYLSVPLELVGSVGGRHVEHPATLTLRRVNDVPGSTEAERRWHIDGFTDTAM